MLFKFKRNVLFNCEVIVDQSFFTRDCIHFKHIKKNLNLKFLTYFQLNYYGDNSSVKILRMGNKNCKMMSDYDQLSHLDRKAKKELGTSLNYTRTLLKADGSGVGRDSRQEKICESTGVSNESKKNKSSRVKENFIPYATIALVLLFTILSETYDIALERTKYCKNYDEVIDSILDFLNYFSFLVLPFNEADALDNFRVYLLSKDLINMETKMKIEKALHRNDQITFNNKFISEPGKVLMQCFLPGLYLDKVINSVSSILKLISFLFTGAFLEKIYGPKKFLFIFSAFTLFSNISTYFTLKYLFEDGDTSYVGGLSGGLSGVACLSAILYPKLSYTKNFISNKFFLIPFLTTSLNGLFNEMIAMFYSRKETIKFNDEIDPAQKYDIKACTPTTDKFYSKKSLRFFSLLLNLSVQNALDFSGSSGYINDHSLHRIRRKLNRIRSDDEKAKMEEDPNTELFEVDRRYLADLSSLSLIVVVVYIIKRFKY